MPKNNEFKPVNIDESVYLLEDFFDLPNPGLRSYFDRVKIGQPDEYRTTFAKGDSVSKVLEDWSSYLEKIEDEWPTLLEFENDLAKKVGPMSVMKPLSERMSDIESYYDCINLDSQPISHSAVAAVVKEWSKSRGLHPRSQAATVNKMKLSTNSGSPYFKKRRLVRDISYPVDFTKLNPSDELPSPWNMHLAKAKGNKDWFPCAVLGWRGQEGGPEFDDVKQRVVWMFPFSLNIAELTIYQVLIECAQKNNIVPAWIGMDAVDRRITELFDTKGDNDLIVCTDFSKFDQHFNSDMQDCAYTILQKLMDQSSKSKDWLNNVFPIKYSIPLAIQMNEIIFGNHGMASGSGGTNADETLVHRALQYEVAQLHGQKLNPNSQCLGDDGILTYPGITVEDVVSAYSSHGQEMNTDKQYASKHDCTYLRRWHHKDYRVDGVCVGVYSTYRALGRLCEQERYYDPEVWSKEMVALRQLSILENCKYHPLKEQFVEFCMKRDKYRLGLDIPGFLSNIERKAKKAIDVMPEFLGYTRTLGREDSHTAYGIQNWWIVQYLLNYQR